MVWPADAMFSLLERKMNEFRSSCLYRSPFLQCQIWAFGERRPRPSTLVAVPGSTVLRCPLWLDRSLVFPGRCPCVRSET
ncbi:hypothetical protein HYQ46_001172 [Verticillium longisporum]|nr:hypothetical protein HYQ46_001172 [Verticillium longisporum]